MVRRTSTRSFPKTEIALALLPLHKLNWPELTVWSKSDSQSQFSVHFGFILYRKCFCFAFFFLYKTSFMIHNFHGNLTKFFKGLQCFPPETSHCKRAKLSFLGGGFFFQCLCTANKDFIQPGQCFSKGATKTKNNGNGKRLNLHLCEVLLDEENYIQDNVCTGLFGKDSETKREAEFLRFFFFPRTTQTQHK